MDDEDDFADLDVRLTLRQWLYLKWCDLKRWFRRCPECQTRGYSKLAPRWEEDRVAQMLGIAKYGCPCCGSGSIEERAEEKRRGK